MYLIHFFLYFSFTYSQFHLYVQFSHSVNFFSLLTFYIFILSKRRRMSFHNFFHLFFSSSIFSVSGYFPSYTMCKYSVLITFFFLAFFLSELIEKSISIFSLYSHFQKTFLSKEPKAQKPLFIVIFFSHYS